eukprot:g77599.t1
MPARRHLACATHVPLHTARAHRTPTCAQSLRTCARSVRSALALPFRCCSAFSTVAASHAQLPENLSGYSRARIREVRDLPGAMRQLQLVIDETDLSPPDLKNRARAGGDVTPGGTGEVSISLLHHHRPFSFQPGQWVDFYIPSIDKIGGYSITSAPCELPRFELVVKAASWPPAKWVTEQARAGDVVYVKVGGDVTFQYDLHRPISPLLLAGGVGLTPFLSILRHMQHIVSSSAGAPAIAKNTANLPRAALIHTCRNQKLFGESLARLQQGLPTQLFYLRQEVTDGSGNGRISRETVRTALSFLTGESPKSPERHAARHVNTARVVPFLCGPAAFIEDMSTLLLDLGFADSDLRVEKWCWLSSCKGLQSSVAVTVSPGPAMSGENERKATPR